MTERDTVVRSLHDLGLAAWFGGTLMGAVGLNKAAAAADTPAARGRVANAGWDAWTPVNAVAISAHLLGGAVILVRNRGRVTAQQGVLSNTVVKTGLTGAALAATAYSRVLGAKLSKVGDVPAEGGTEPSTGTPPELASAQRQLKIVQWVIPALTGAIVVSTALQGEQQKPDQVAGGIVKRALQSVA